MNVAVIGASDKPDRYSYKAVVLLQEKGHTAFAVHSRIKRINDLVVYPSLKDITEKIDTITLYVNANISSQMAEDIISLNPRRIIFNPGAENNSLEEKAHQRGIQTIFACTLVLLITGQF